MTTYAALLRAVNVGGRTVPMAQLRELFSTLGYGNVRTYIQSGNVVFDSQQREAALVAALERSIEDAFGIAVKVLVRSRPELAAIAKSHPLARGGVDPKGLHVTFLAKKAAAAKVRAIDATAFAPDEFEVAGREVFSLYPNGYGRTKMHNAFFEKALGVAATTRNWNTVLKLRDLTAE